MIEESEFYHWDIIVMTKISVLCEVSMCLSGPSIIKLHLNWVTFSGTPWGKSKKVGRLWLHGSTRGKWLSKEWYAAFSLYFSCHLPNSGSHLLRLLQHTSNYSHYSLRRPIYHLHKSRLTFQKFVLFLLFLYLRTYRRFRWGEQKFLPFPHHLESHSWNFECILHACASFLDDIPYFALTFKTPLEYSILMSHHPLKTQG